MTSDPVGETGRMQVALYATLRQISGGKYVDVTALGAATLRTVLAEVLERHPAMRPELLDAGGELHRHVHVFLNGRDAHHLDRGLDTPLPAGAKIDLFPAVGGG